MKHFELNETPYEFRSLKREDPMLEGYDVFGLQCLLLASGYGLELDGILGDETATQIWRYQKNRGLEQDGKAGPVTQRYLVLDRIHPETSFFRLPQGLLRGMINQESSFWVGNYTVTYNHEPVAGTKDLGLCMRNTFPTQENCVKWFDGRWAIQFLAGDPERGLRPRKNKYYGKPGAQTHQRAWELAAASWHQPSYADHLANGGNLSPAQRDHLEKYIQKTTSYVKKWIE